MPRRYGSNPSGSWWPWSSTNFRGDGTPHLLLYGGRLLVISCWSPCAWVILLGRLLFCDSCVFLGSMCYTCLRMYLYNISGSSIASSPLRTNHGCQNAMSKKSPGDFIKQVLGRPVIVKLNNGADYRGILSCLDGYMNLAMEQTEEYVDGQLKHKYGDTFIRGNNVLYISAQPKK